MENLEKFAESVQQAREKNALDKALRKERAEELVNFLKRISFYQTVTDLMEDKNPPLEFLEFKDFLVRMNGILRGIPIDERDLADENVSVGMLNRLPTPNVEDKEMLLREAYESIKLVDKKDLQYMLPLLVTTIHPFEDGNGRIARILHVILNEHENEDEFYDDIQKVICKTDKESSINLSPSVGWFHEDIKYELSVRHLNEKGYIDEEDINWKEYIEIVIEAFTNPEKYRAPLKDRDMTLKDYFIEEARKSTE